MGWVVKILVAAFILSRFIVIFFTVAWSKLVEGEHLHAGVLAEKALNRTQAGVHFCCRASTARWAKRPNLGQITKQPAQALRRQLSKYF